MALALRRVLAGGTCRSRRRLAGCAPSAGCAAPSCVAGCAVGRSPRWDAGDDARGFRSGPAARLRSFALRRRPAIATPPRQPPAQSRPRSRRPARRSARPSRRRLQQARSPARSARIRQVRIQQAQCPSPPRFLPATDRPDRNRSGTASATISTDLGNWRLSLGRLPRPQSAQPASAGASAVAATSAAGASAGFGLRSMR